MCSRFKPLGVFTSISSKNGSNRRRCRRYRFDVVVVLFVQRDSSHASTQFSQWPTPMLIGCRSRSSNVIRCANSCACFCSPALSIRNAVALLFQAPSCLYLIQKNGDRPLRLYSDAMPDKHSSLLHCLLHNSVSSCDRTTYCARQELNLQPLAPEANALSN